MARPLSNGLRLGPASTDPLLITGTGTPEASVTAPPGSVYYDRNGGIWEKATGTGNTGWNQTDNVGGQVNSTNWFHLPHTGVSTVIFGANGEARYHAWYVSWPFTLDGLAFECTTAGTSGGTCLVRVGIHDQATNGQPGAVILDAGTVDCGTTGTKTFTGLNTKLKPGWYFIVVAQQGAPVTRATIRTISQGYINPALNFGSTTADTGTGARQSFTVASAVTGALAANPTVSLGAQNPPRYQFKPLSVP